MNGIGCAIVLLVAVVWAFFAITGQVIGGNADPAGAFAYWAVIAAIIVGIVYGRRHRKSKNLVNVTNAASFLQQWVDGSSKFAETAKSEEQTFFELQNIELLEYKSQGSDYQSVQGGLIVPVVGKVSAYGGVSKGQSTKKPESLVPVDKGKLIVTNQKVVFVGVKQSRDWDWKKIVDIQAGPNGLTAKIASTSNSHNSYLQHFAYDQIPIGAALGIVDAWNTGGEAEAKKYAQELLDQFNKTIAEHTPKPKLKS